MKAEIGFVVDDDGWSANRIKLVVTAQSRTESTALRLFALRTGIAYDEMSSEIEILEPAKETTTP